MRHHLFEESPTNTYPIAILVKTSAFNKTDVLVNYVDPIRSAGVSLDQVIAFDLPYNQAGKAPAGHIKDYLKKLLPALVSLGTRLLYVTDAAFFKVLTGQPKAEPHLGYVLPCKMTEGLSMEVVLGLNHQALIYNPALQAKLDLSLKTLVARYQGSYQALGGAIVHSAYFPDTYPQIKEALERLKAFPSLSCDIEAFSLRFWEAGVGTISFAWDEHNGIAFPCDYAKVADQGDGVYGSFIPNLPVRKLLKEFFESYEGELTFHKADYDVGVLIYTLWMQHPLDNRGLLEGLDVLTRRLHDTKVIAYLATNSTAGNQLGLKTLAHEFAGNWAVEVKDITRVPLTKLLNYNLVDGLSTLYVKRKYWPIMVQDQQLELYEQLMLPSLKLIIQMQLTGMPMCPETLMDTKTKLQQLQSEHLDKIISNPTVIEFNLRLQEEAMVAANAKLKIKQHPLSKFKEVRLNPNSGPQLQKLFYEEMGLPVIDLTDTKLPATGAETIEKLINHTQEPDHKILLQALIDYSKVTKILSTFIPAFEAGLMKENGRRYLHGNFNLGGTVSGRLSSSDPNMQNLPAGSTFGKLIKEIFKAPDGWIFAGADFNSLEDYISALTTKDPNKLNVYIKGFDGHCLRAAYYFKEDLPHIDLEDPKSVNTIKKTHPELRQESKAPTFLLTYGGTYHGMMSNLGWPEEKSKAIEANYHELYKVSDEYVYKRLEQASKDGYVEVAFGLRLRTPLLKQVMFGQKGMPYEAAAEGRTAGNAMGQSYGLLNNRAAVAFFEVVWASKYRYDILPVALIHDAIYILMRDDVRVVEFANRELIKAMRWQELPEIQHPTVKLGAALDLFWPSWAHPITLPNDCGQDTIIEACNEAKTEKLISA